MDFSKRLCAFGDIYAHFGEWKKPLLLVGSGFCDFYE